MKMSQQEKLALFSESEKLLLTDSDSEVNIFVSQPSSGPLSPCLRDNLRRNQVFGTLLVLTVITYIVSIKLFQGQLEENVVPLVNSRHVKFQSISSTMNDTNSSSSELSVSGPKSEHVNGTETPLLDLYDSSEDDKATSILPPEEMDDYVESTTAQEHQFFSSTTEKASVEKQSKMHLTNEVMSEEYDSTAPSNFTENGSTYQYDTTLAPPTTISPGILNTNGTNHSDGTLANMESAEAETTERPDTLLETFLLNSYASQTCKLPKLDPNHLSVRNITKSKNPPPHCSKTLLYKIEIGNPSTLVQIKDPSKSGWSYCCYKLVFRGPKETDNSETFSKTCIPITKERLSIPLTHEFIAIFCNSTKNATNTRQIMVDAFALAPLKQSVEERILKFHNTSQIAATDQINLVVLGLDAVSHMNFIRIMPKVHKYLVDNLSAFWLDGYTKIGDNTFPNLLGMLTAQNVSVSKASCQKAKYFDDCPFIWKNFSQRGYRTAFGEDSPWMGVFTYLKNGFKRPPTDYYLRPISRVAEKNIKYDQRGNAYICYGPRLSFEFLLNNMRALATTMGPDRRYFQLIWATSLTHDYVNYGRMGENVLLKYIKWMHKFGHLNNTVFVLTSDHGIRWGPMRSTHQGKIEENMPFLYFVFPEAFISKYSTAISNLLTNRGRLTTPFDTHETFGDILDLRRIENMNIVKRTKELVTLDVSKKLPRGISLFLPIPKSRTCEMAEIAEHWCVCHTSKAISVSDAEVQQAANYVVFTLNSFISKYTKCAFLALDSVQYAMLINPTNKKKFGVKGENVMELSFSTMPGNGTFDATVVRNSKDQWSVSGVISRTNLYGNLSYCVDDTDMKKYCYCLH